MSTDITIWKWIPGFECRYAVSNTGLVASYVNKEWQAIGKCRILSPGDIRGYLRVNIYNKAQVLSRMLVHRAVLFAFVGKCPEGMEAIHIDGNAKNNHISNLKWGTHGENMGMDRGHNHSFKGNKNPNCKLTAVQVHEIRIAYKKGGWWGRREFSKKLGVTETQVGRIAKRLYGGWK